MPSPNLIYVFADQLRYDALGLNGNLNAVTPNIDSLSRDCLCFDNCISGHPVCAPYRASLFTGKYTPSTGMIINELRINPNHETFADVLNLAGYETCYIGKWHMYANRKGHHLSAENSYIPKGPDRLGFNDYFAAYNFHHEYFSPKAYYHLDSPEKLPVEGYEPDFMTDLAVTQLERLSENGKPFAMFLSLGTPHDPWTGKNVPQKYLDLVKDKDYSNPENYKNSPDAPADMWARFLPFQRGKLSSWRKVYAAMVSNLDENIGKLYRKLEDMNMAENTIFVFTSDHGEMFGSHGRRAKNIFFEEALHVPMFMRFGNKLPCGHTDVSLNSVDIMPTLLSLMGLPIPKSVQGEDVSNKLTNPASEDRPLLIMGTGPTAVFRNGLEYRGIRTNRYTYAVYKNGKEFLFDRLTDTGELDNLAENSEYEDIKNSLREDMFRVMKNAGDDFLTCREYKQLYISNRIIQNV